MVVDVASLVPKIGGFAGGAVTWLIIGIGIVIVLLLIGAFVWWRISKKKWNLDVEFKLTRNDGRITNAEWGQGAYVAKKGVVYVKRPSAGKFSNGYPIKIFDIRRYLQGDRIITVIQVGPEDYRPVLNDSWSSNTYQCRNTAGEIVEVKEAIINIKVDSGLNKAWKSAWDVVAKQAYSITSLIQQFQTPIAIGIVIVCCFVGFAILYTKIH